MELWNPRERKAVIDGDLLVYAAAAKFNKDTSPDAAYAYIENELLWMRNVLDLDSCEIFTTAGGNFRKDVADTYKAHRKVSDRPQWLIPCYKYLYDKWHSHSERGYEADDLLGIAVTENPDWLLVSYDKDLNQIPGHHYNWRKYELYYVTPEEGDYFLAKQMLQGDAADNIKGVPGIGPKKAEKLLEGQPRETLLEHVFQVYKDNDLSWEQYSQNYRLLKILRSKEIRWPELEEIQK